MSRTLPLIEHFPHITNLGDPHGMYQLALAYLYHLKVRNYAEATLRHHEFCLFWFLEWCGQRDLIRPSEVSKPVVERYQRYLFHYRKKNGNPLSTRSQYGRLSVVREWFKWLTRENYLLHNPAGELRMPRIERRLPAGVLTETEAESVLSQADIGTPMGLRDRAMMEVLYSTGMRRSELVHLKLGEIDGERGTIIIRQGKGRKDRMVPVGDRAVRWVDKYLNEVRPTLACGQDESYVFLTPHGRGLEPETFSMRVKDYIEAAGIKKRGSCHMFRHTMATLMLENGADIRFIQAMLGHVKLATTEAYAQVSIKKLKEIHTLTHPARLFRTKQVDWEAQEEAEEILSEAELMAALTQEALEEEEAD